MRQCWTMAGFAVSLAVALGSAGAFAEPLIGSVVQKPFKGAVGTRVAATSEPLYFGDEVFAQETVTTPANGATVMRFHDQTQLQMGANSTVVLDRFVYDPNVDSADATIKFTQGAFRYIGGQAKTEDNIHLSTPTTTLTIRGTEFTIFVADDGATTVSVVEGQVDVQPCGPTKPAHATEGQTFHVSPTCEMTHGGFAPTDPAVVNVYSVTDETGFSKGSSSEPVSKGPRLGGDIDGDHDGSTPGNP